MKRADTRFRVGLALTAGCTLLFVLVFSLDGTMSWVQGSASIQVRFPGAQGLMKADPVHFHGVPCGRVISLQFDGAGFVPPGDNIALAEERENDDVSVLLTLEVPHEVRSYLREGSIASIQKTLTGVTVVNLEQGDGGPLADGVVLDGVPEATISDVAGAMETAVQTLTRVLGELEPIVRELRDEGTIGATIDRFGSAADEVRDLAERLDDTVEDLHDPLRSLTMRAGELIEEFERAAGEIPETLDDVRGTVRHGREFVSDLRGLIRDASPDVKSSLEDIALATENARTLSEELRRRPWRLLKAPNSSDAAAIDLYETAARYAAGALEVRRSLELVRTALSRRGADADANALLEDALRTLENDLANQQEVERMFWERMNDGD